MCLYKDVEGALKTGKFANTIPDYIENNLSKRIVLREYQVKAFLNTQIYLETDLSKDKPRTHILYHMATGSGKTVIMAMNILYYYKKGYRNFLFFTNRTNIVSKTKINFTKKESVKYLFAQNIVIDNKNIPVNIVDTFSESDPEAINICFNTVQGIQSSLSILHEGRLNISDFEDNEVVLIADEAHHLNSTTTKDKEEEEENKTWEDTVSQLLSANIKNVLLEYTATCDLRDANVAKKYKDKIIFNFPLAEFREAGYTKEFSNYHSDSNKWNRTLQALIISEFRKLMFQKHKIDINPVVLLKSKTIKNSNDFYDEFFEKLSSLDSSQINAFRKNSSTNVYLSNAFDFFKSIDMKDSMLVDLIKTDFAEEHAVNMNSLNEENENIVNNLDEKGNQYRLIFIVDKLTEGWDVLSLFDIVRLYDTRVVGPKGSVSKYTISEAQLIGRGARYCPFRFESDQPLEKRKYANVGGTPEAICETLLYHCLNDSRYINELKMALIETGLASPEERIEVHYVVKDSFKQSSIYKQGQIFVNERKEKSRNDVKSLDYKIKNLSINYNCSSNVSSTILLFEKERKDVSLKRKELPAIKLKDIEFNILYKSYRTFNQVLAFDILKVKFPNLSGIQEFLTSDNYLGNAQIILHKYEEEEVSVNDYLSALKILFEEVASYVSKIKINYEGTKEFKAIPISERITNLIRKYSKDKMDKYNGVGIPQNDPYVDDKYRYDVTDKDWYVYNNNFGTTEEKSFIKYFASKMSELEKQYDNIYVLRNEQQVKVYSFENGEAFEPDYILILTKKGETKNLYLNVFVEPKGSQLILKDSWKGDALLEFSKSSIPVVKFVDDNDYRIWGTPLYNEELTFEQFDTYFKEAFLK